MNDHVVHWGMDLYHLYEIPNIYFSQESWVYIYKNDFDT